MYVLLSASLHEVYYVLSVSPSMDLKDCGSTANIMRNSIETLSRSSGYS